MISDCVRYHRYYPVGIYLRTELVRKGRRYSRLGEHRCKARHDPVQHRRGALSHRPHRDRYGEASYPTFAPGITGFVARPRSMTGQRREAQDAVGSVGWRMCRVRAGGSTSGELSSLWSWDALIERERQLGILEGQPFLLRPDGWPDRDVSAYFASGSFRRLALQTQLSYASDLKVHLSFLASQGVDWRDATVDTFLDFEFWRRRDPRNVRRISGAKFARELAACRRFYEWQVRRGVIDRSPVVVDEVQRGNGTVRTAVRLRPSNARASRVKWLTPRAYGRWRDVGLGGYGADGLRDGSWRGRNDVRNVAFADMLWSSGLRLREGATLLSFEVPGSFGGSGFIRGRLGEAIAKGGGRDFWVSRRALRSIEGYVDSTRAAAVRRAQGENRYDALDRVMVASSVTKNRQMVFSNERGVSGRVSLDALSAEDRYKVFVEGDGGLEPAMMWLTESGMPMPYDTWKRVFAVANTRCTSQGVGIRCHAHMLRHSFALRMLVTLMHRFDQRFGLTPQERREYRTLFGDPYACVQMMLGHRSRETTENTYLEPVKGLQVELFLNGDVEDDEAVGALLSGIALTSPRIRDER